MAVLLAVLAWAVIRPWGLPEAVLAVPGAALVIAAGAISPAHALAEARRLGPVIGFLAAVLVLAQLCAGEGLFRACGHWLSARGGRPARLLAQVFLIAAVTTAVLSLDATVVLLTPVVFATAARLGVRPKPHVYACTHLANSASLLLPVANLTNLLAFAASGLAFTRFAAHGAGTSIPWAALLVLAATLAGFVIASAAGVNPAWAALTGACVLAVRALARHRTGPVALIRAADVPFLLFVLALGIIVNAVVSRGLGAALGHLVPRGASLAALLGLAALAATAANLINNLPAVLVLLPLTAPAGPGAVLAMLIGVNIGPNLTYAGSLATLLWRRVLHEHESGPSLREFTRLGLLTVPPGLVLAVLALWGALHVIGG